MNYDQEKLNQFQKDNGMTLDEAFSHVKEWNLSGKNEEAIRGCEEIVKFFPNHEAKELLEKLKNNNQNSKKPTILEKAGSTLADKMTGAIDTIKQKHEQSQSKEENELENKHQDEFEQKIQVAKSQLTTNDERLWGAVSYAWILVLYPLLFKRDSVYINFHSRQGLVLFGFLYLFSFFIGGMFKVVGLGFMAVVIGVLYVPFLFFMAFQAYSGKWMKIPGIWSIAKKINL